MTIEALADHPAKYSAPILELLRQLVDQTAAAGPYLTGPVRVLDPFAGVGRIHDLAVADPPAGAPIETWGVELEPEWAANHERTLVGDATALPFEPGSFDIVATSPCYGSRMADHHEARDACKQCANGIGPDGGSCKACSGSGLSKRNTYTHRLGRLPTSGSAAVLEFLPGYRGEPYRRLHQAAWWEAWRVLRPHGRLLVNVSNSIDGGVERRVVEWHLETILAMTRHASSLADDGSPCWRLEGLIPVSTRRLRQGANHDARVEQEFVLAFRRR